MSDKIFVTRSSMPPYEEYIDMIKPLWESHWLTNMGVYHDQLEKKIGDYLKINKDLALVSSGHIALEMAIKALNLPVGSEVITTPFTFISTTHAIIRNGLKPVFCDINYDTYTIDVSRIEMLITENTSAIIPVHVYGNVCDIEEIKNIADRYHLKVIYDAAHAFGVEKDGVGIGNFGDAAIFSFHATKVFNTIEGGAVVCKNEEMYKRVKSLRNFGIHSEELVLDVGLNAKMNEFEAIMGICNLKHINEELEKRKLIVECYENNLKEQRQIRLPKYHKGIKQNYAYFPILIDDLNGYNMRDQVYNKLREKSIYPRKYFYPLTSDHVCFKNKYMNTNLECARYISKRILVLPLYSDLDIKSVEKICCYIKRILSI